MARPDKPVSLALNKKEETMPNDKMDKNVYILGAGFSKEIGLPLQDDFLLLAKEVYFRHPQKYQHFNAVFDYQDKLSKMRQFLSYPLLNLEHLFNIMEMDIFYSKNQETVRIKNDFVNLIKDVLMELTPSPFYHDDGGSLRTLKLYENYLLFLKLLIQNDEFQVVPHNDTIITFNYDLVVESAAALYNHERYQRRKEYRHERGEYLRLNTMFGKENLICEDICNFFYKNGARTFCDNVTIFSQEDRAIKLLKLHGSINWKTTRDNETFIVPPTWNKSDPEVRKLWDIAYQELMTAKRIVVIGYSFPETDIYVKSLLALALNENRILQGIYFVNPDKERAQNTCLALLDSHFQKYCSYKPLKFSELVKSDEGKKFISENLGRSI